jgi:AraC-like DNA-binding protein
MKLYIKNMVSTSCKVVVQSELENLGLHVTKVELGEAEIQENISDSQLAQIRTIFKKFSFELLNDKKSVLVEKIKNAIIELVRYSDEPVKINYSNYLSDKLKYNYNYLANRFSEVQGTTIEKHIISHKIERVKELLAYDELNLTEIAHKLNYSSVSHLSNQFKKTTGLTPSRYKEFGHGQRISLDSLR